MACARLRWVLILALAACPRKIEKYFVEKVDWGAPAFAQAPLAEEEIHREFFQRIERSASLRLAKPGERAPRGAKAIRLALELDFGRDGEGRLANQKVAAAMSVRRKVDDVWRHSECFGTGKSKEMEDSAEGRQAAARRALSEAIAQVVGAAELELIEWDKPDRQVVRDLGDPKLRDVATQVLAERKNPAAIEPLLDKLKGDDPYEVRRAMGALVALREPRAVPLLIDVARGKDWGFLRELLFAIGEIGGEEAEAYLYTVAQGHDQPPIRAAAQQALDELATRAKREAGDASVRGVNARRAP